MNYRDHLLVILMEECAEVAQTCSKSLRFGLNDGYPEKGTTNLEDLREELSQLMAVVDMIEKDLKRDHTDEESVLFDSVMFHEKQSKVFRFLERSRASGRLEEFNPVDEEG